VPTGFLNALNLPPPARSLGIAAGQTSKFDIRPVDTARCSNTSWGRPIPVLGSHKRPTPRFNTFGHHWRLTNKSDLPQTGDGTKINATVLGQRLRSQRWVPADARLKFPESDQHRWSGTQWHGKGSEPIKTRRIGVPGEGPEHSRSRRRRTEIPSDSTSKTALDTHP